MTLPKVSIVVTAYLKANKRYLDLCVRSIKNLNYPADLLDVVVVTHRDYQPEYAGVKVIWPDKEKYWNSEGMNFGVAHSHPDSKFLLILNDDTMLTKNSLRNLVLTVGDNLFCVNALSPCDNGIRYHLHFGFTHDGVRFQLPERAYEYEHLEKYFDSMLNSDSYYPAGLVSQDFLCIYATLIPRKVWEMVGEFDERFRTGPEDIDFSRRAKEKGVHLFSVLDALIWHFGGVTAKHTIDPAQRLANEEAYVAKWKDTKHLGCTP